MAVRNLARRRFGRLRVLRPGRRHGRKQYWLCECDCGQSREVRSDNLLGGVTKSCGCLYVESRCRVNLKHGQNHAVAFGGQTGTYRAYHRQKQWTRNPRCREYRRYGARGIELRFSTFEEFFREVGSKPGEDYELRRINPDSHFMAGNLQWIRVPRRHRHKRN